jgi:hypothetical protein
MAGHGRSKNGVASLAYSRSQSGVAWLAYARPATPFSRFAHRQQDVDARDKPAQDAGLFRPPL